MASEYKKGVIHAALQVPFNEANFFKMVREILKKVPDDKRDRFDRKGAYIYNDFSPYVTRFQRIGKYISPDKKRVDILIVHLKKETSLERARTMQRNFVAKYLKDNKGSGIKHAALVAFVSPNGADWRLSFVKVEYKFDDAGKPIPELSHARRYSFLIEERSHTAQSRLLSAHTNPTLGQLECAFSVEPVTDEFFEKYRDLFHRLEELLDDIRTKNTKVKREFKKQNINTADFAKKLLGQIVFLYFLQKKGWFGVPRGKKWGDGSKNYLRELFEKEHGDYQNFFNNILEPLFYEALSRIHTDDYHTHFDSRIPFLNGGLFDPINQYDWINVDILLPKNIFSNSSKTGILDVFDQYNFTVNENEPLEKEVAVDPEMLGKVFEKLLPVKDRQSGGTYYTPRDIVHYMCQESLANYLVTELEGEISKADMRKFIKYGEDVVENENRVVHKGKTGTYKPQLPESVCDEKNAKCIDDKLASIRVCDPAVGSGAFLLGMMNEIVKARNILSPYVNNGKLRPLYDFKHQAIENSLYGVDIDSSATEIAKLRLWLSLIVDEKDRNAIKPLPNLDFKIVQGNSLFSVKKDLLNNNLFDKLEKLEPLFFSEIEPSQKQNYRNKRKELINRITGGIFDLEVHFSKVFREKKGFDVVIANPPYIKERDNKDVFETVTTTDWGKEWSRSKMNFWYFFLHKAIEIARGNGVISFITSRYWLNGYGAQKLIRHVKAELSFTSVVDIGKLKVFDEVVGQHMVATYVKGKKIDEFKYKKLENNLSDIDEDTDTKNIAIKTLKNSTLYSNDSIQFDSDQLTYANVVSLGSIFNVSQGVVQNPDKISKEVAEKYGLTVGEGVFVLSEEEWKSLNLSVSEQAFVKPFFDEHDVHRFLIQAEQKKYLLYITKKNCPDVDKYPNLKTHLGKYKKIMLNRRETKKGSNSWFHMHWPRKSLFFESPKIVLPAMFDKPSAGYEEGSGYFGMSSNVIISKDESYALKFLLAILNSEFACYWFDKHGKKRGVGVDIGVSKLREFPIKKASSDEQKPFIEIVDKILAITGSGDYLQNPTKQAQVCAYEKDIDKLVYQLYDLTPEEIEIIKANNPK